MRLHSRTHTISFSASCSVRTYTVSCYSTRLPEKGATTGSIIGAIIGVILLLAIIGTAIAMYRKHRNNKLTGDGPPKHKPPPPKKTTSSASTDLDANHDDDDYVEDVREHYHSAAPSGWDDPGNNECSSVQNKPGADSPLLQRKVRMTLQSALCLYSDHRWGFEEELNV
ncbi:hypothetical protein F7725_017995 [Dissostichus mawsoni]|uniref:Uncharacterized protein n=1 Tax=Dissostichus mawsoni TaxID=36200 RepID=A0A7J5XT55_DISMA|nr:hypothetical protein F7725_017995 [Dissostichus mawsoni]